MMRSWRTAGAAAGLLLAAAILPGDASAQGGPASVAVDPVTLVEVAETQTLIARLVAVNESTVATRIPGIVSEVSVQVGDRVAKGDAIAELDRELLAIEQRGAEAMLLQAEAGLGAAQANVDLAEQVYERTTRLRGSAAFSQGRFEDLATEVARATAELARAEAALAVARTSVATARYREENATIRAPFDGVVVARLAGPGDYLQAGSPVLRIIDDLTLEVEADVPTEIVAGLDPGDAVSAIVDDGTVARAIVRAVVPSESPATRTRPVRFTIDVEGTTKPLAAGQSVILRAPVGPPREALSVAKDALVQQSGGWIVFVAEDGKATPRRVTIGAAAGGRFEVQGDLEAGELVVVRGNERLRPGQDIAYEAPAAAVASDAAQATGERATN